MTDPKAATSPDTGAAPVIDVRKLEVSFGGRQGIVRAVRGISFALGREKLGIVGESGSGKSMTGRAIMRLMPPNARLSAERLAFHDQDLLAASERDMTRLRGRRIALIMQDPKYSLNPVVRVGDQIVEAFRLHHRKASRQEAEARMLAMLETVKIRDPKRVAALYPHEVSGGMGQRVMIAMMLIAGPEVLIADEPTSALDVTVRLEVLALLNELIETKGLSLVFISHDLNLVRRFCDRVLIMYQGTIVEDLPAARLAEAEHPYTRGLLGSLPSIHHPVRRLATLARDPAWAVAAEARR